MMRRLALRLLARLVSDGESPERLSLAVSLGAFLGFNPPFGYHTVAALALAYWFGLNRMAVLAGMYLNTPWTMIPYYAFATWLGIRLTGLPEGTRLPHAGLRDLVTLEFWRSLVQQWELVFPAALGCLLLAAVIALLTYPVTLVLARRCRQAQAGWRDGAQS